MSSAASPDEESGLRSFFPFAIGLGRLADQKGGCYCSMTVVSSDILAAAAAVIPSTTSIGK